MVRKEIVVQCPSCNKKFSYYESEYRPFCGERCRMIDLGHWLQESYSVPIEEDGDEELENGDDSEFEI